MTHHIDLRTALPIMRQALVNKTLTIHSHGVASGCVYRDRLGHTCIIGAAIPDEHLAVRMGLHEPSGGRIGGLIAYEVVTANEDEVDVLIDLQYFYDTLVDSPMPLVRKEQRIDEMLTKIEAQTA